MSQLALPGVCGDFAVRGDCDPRIELIAGRTIDALSGGSRGRHTESSDEARRPKTDDEGCRTLEEVPPGDSGVAVHRCAPCAYCRSACIIRVFAPHRQSTPDSACRMPASEARAFRSR